MRVCVCVRACVCVCTLGWCARGRVGLSVYCWCASAACPTHWPKDIVLPVKEVRDAGEAGPSDGNFPLNDIITASDWTSSLSSKEGNFYGTSTKDTYSTTNRRKTPSLRAGSYSAVVSHAEATPLAADSVDEVPSATVRDIFGSGSEDETESLSFLDDATGGGSKDKVRVKAEVGGARSGTSDDDFEQFVRAEVASGEEEAKRQAAAQVLFTKVLSGLNGEGVGGDGARGRGSSIDSALTKYGNKGVKSKRRAHPNAGVSMWVWSEEMQYIHDSLSVCLSVCLSVFHPARPCAIPLWQSYQWPSHGQSHPK